MPNLLVAQLDYIYFFYGLVLFLLGSICLSMSRGGPLPTPWWILGAFAFTHGFSEWLHLAALTGGDSRAFSLARTVLVGVSFLLLLEFARRTHRIVQGTTVSPWLHALLVGVLAGLALAFGPTHLESAVRPVIAAPAAFWTVGLFLIVASRNEALGGGADSRRARKWAAFYFGAYGLAAGLIVPRSPFLPGPWPTTEVLLGVTGVPVQLLRALLVCGMALSVWALAVSFDPIGSVLRKKRFLFWMMASTIVALLAAGWFFTDRLGKLHEKDVIDEAEASAGQIFSHLADDMREADGGGMALASLLSHFHVTGTAIGPARLDEVVDSMALASEGWVVYVIDPAGRVIASSNRGQPDSFLGKNFAIRSYIKDSLHGRPGRFLGVGIVSGVPGFYASEPVRSADGQVVAVAVVKRNLTIDQLGPAGVDTAYIVTAEGRTILTNGENQENRPLWSKVVGASYGPTSEHQEREALPALLDHVVVGTEWVTIGGQKEIAVSRLIPGSDWSLVVLKQEKTQVANRLLGIVITLLLCLVVLTYFVAMQRQYGTESLISTKRRDAERRAREFARKADTDALTGVLNRLGFNGAFSREFERARRYRQPLSVVILDLDHFKRVNDDHGHVAGDQVLVGLARLLEANVRESDIIARWGGEEFVILVPMTLGRGAVQLAEKIRGLMAVTPLAPSGAVTGSFGVAQLQDGDGIEGLLHRADAALYRAKNGGRNRVECADADVAEAVARDAAGAGPQPESRSASSIYTETGFTPLDKEHRVLGGALEDFVRTVNAGEAEQVQLALESVIAGMGVHFKEEERLMEEFAYPLLKRHQETHALFVDDAVRFLEDLKQNGVTVNFRRWAVGRMVEWFRFHILAYDVGLGQFLRKAGGLEGAGH